MAFAAVLIASVFSISTAVLGFSTGGHTLLQSVGLAASTGVIVFVAVVAKAMLCQFLRGRSTTLSQAG